MALHTTISNFTSAFEFSNSLEAEITDSMNTEEATGQVTIRLIILYVTLKDIHFSNI